jgi:MFS superfamily sulfate permease-like transporter
MKNVVQRVFRIDPLLRWSFPKELLSSIVVFLVALPLCIAIAIGSGMDPRLGIICGVVGGIVTGYFAGSPLQVSGPAAGLMVLVAGFVAEYGVAAMGVVTLVTGVLQVVSGKLRFGRFFRAASPSVVHGMLAGIGVSILASQLHVAFDASPVGGPVANFIALPGRFMESLSGAGIFAFGIALLVVAVMVLWEKYRPDGLNYIPGALVAVVVATVGVIAFQLEITTLDLGAGLAEAIILPSGDWWTAVQSPGLWGAALVFAIIASAESMLSAAAVDQIHDGPRTNYDQELVAQGIGNSVCGLLGTMPMTGVIVRSKANVDSGAKTRLSAMMHGIWLLVLVVFASGMLTLIPGAALAGILLLIGVKLVNVPHIRHMWHAKRSEAVIYVTTMTAIAVTDLLSGVVIGMAAFALFQLYRLSTMQVEAEAVSDTTWKLSLRGAGTFMAVPTLATTLDGIPLGIDITIDIQDLHYADAAVAGMLESWVTQRRKLGAEIELDRSRLDQISRRVLAPSAAPVAMPPTTPASFVAAE